MDENSNDDDGLDDLLFAAFTGTQEECLEFPVENEKLFKEKYEMILQCSQDLEDCVLEPQDSYLDKKYLVKLSDYCKSTMPAPKFLNLKHYRPKLPPPRIVCEKYSNNIHKYAVVGRTIDKLGQKTVVKNQILLTKPKSNETEFRKLAEKKYKGKCSKGRSKYHSKRKEKLFVKVPFKVRTGKMHFFNEELSSSESSASHDVKDCLGGSPSYFTNTIVEGKRAWKPSLKVQMQLQSDKPMYGSRWNEQLERMETIEDTIKPFKFPPGLREKYTGDVVPEKSSPKLDSSSSESKVRKNSLSSKKCGRAFKTRLSFSKKKYDNVSNSSNMERETRTRDATVSDKLSETYTTLDGRLRVHFVNGIPQVEEISEEGNIAESVSMEDSESSSPLDSAALLTTIDMNECDKGSESETIVAFDKDSNDSLKIKELNVPLDNTSDFEGSADCLDDYLYGCENSKENNIGSSLSSSVRKGVKRKLEPSSARKKFKGDDKSNQVNTNWSVNKKDFSLCLTNGGDFSGKIICAFCGTKKFCYDSRKSLKFGSYTCEGCRKIIVKTINKLMKSSCRKNSGQCNLDVHPFCNACLLKIVLERSVTITRKTYEKIYGLLPEEIRASLPEDPKLRSKSKLNGGVFESSKNALNSKQHLQHINGTLPGFPESKKKAKLPSSSSSSLNNSAYGVSNRLALKKSDSYKAARVKHVSRTQAEVLGLPLATFPSQSNSVGSGSEPEIGDISVDLYSGGHSNSSLHEQSDKVERTEPCDKSSSRSNIKVCSELEVPNIITKRCYQCLGCCAPECGVCDVCIKVKKKESKGLSYKKKRYCLNQKCISPRVAAPRVLKKPGQVSVFIPKSKDQIHQ